MTSLQLVFAGTPQFSLPCLKALAESKHNVLAVYTQPDRPAGRGKHQQPSPVKTFAESLQLPVIQPKNFKQEDDILALADLKPDVLIVIAYGLILPQRVLDIPRLGCINVHASLLPAFRGAAPIQDAILRGESETGITIMQMEAGLDTGPMWLQKSCPIEPTETAGSLHDKLAEMAPNLLLETLDRITEGSAEPVPQNNDRASYAPKIKKEDARINWQEQASLIHRKIRAYNPWPIATLAVNETLIRVHEASVVNSPKAHTPGQIIQLDKHGLLVGTGKDALLIHRFQFPGKKVMSVADWLNAHHSMLYPGLCLQ